MNALHEDGLSLTRHDFVGGLNEAAKLIPITYDPNQHAIVILFQKIKKYTHTYIYIYIYYI
jgi:hypothetical protein